VNLLGDHTDYNDGFVLPTAIPQRTTVELAVGSGRHEIFSANLDEVATVSPGEDRRAGFERYVIGCIRELQAEGLPVPPLRIAIRSEVPLGAGLSSSAALEVAVLRAIDRRFEFGLDPVRLAHLAQRAEINHAGVSCGIMDQMASSVITLRGMLYLDTRSMHYKLLPIPNDAAIVVVHSGVERRLSATPYNERRSECRAAADLLGVASLRDVRDPSALRSLPENLRQRARHVVTENARVVQATRADAAEFGALMRASHASLRDDYNVSHPAVDELVRALNADPDVFGARMTGAGFGGACVALVRSACAHEITRRVTEAAGERSWRAIVPPCPLHIP
jgi:galactokinase